MSSQNNLLNQINEQKKIIHYLQEKHLENTGYQVPLPQSWQEFLSIYHI